MHNQPSQTHAQTHAAGSDKTAPSNPQLKGIEQLPGTYAFDLAASARGMRLNRFLIGLGHADKRAAYKADAEAAMAAAGLSETERELLRRLDWLGLVKLGASFFTLEKLARCHGVPNPAMCAQMRGETLPQFLQTRRVPGAM